MSMTLMLRMYCGKLPAFSLVCVMTLLLYWPLAYYHHWKRSGKRTFNKDHNLKYIVHWNNYGRVPDFYLTPGEGHDIFVNANCSVNTCYVTLNREYIPLEEADALVIDVRSYVLLKSNPKYLGYVDEPPVRSAHQRYIFYDMEPPTCCPFKADLISYAGYFNWTMTYRLDSDIPRPYGWVVPRNKTTSSVSSTWLTPHFDYGEQQAKVVARKTKLVAWMASHCRTAGRRENYVKALSKVIAVDVYGDCGTMYWPKENLEEFYNMLSRDYKFYLSFENALCKDYVTEKLFGILRHDVVPIVYGDAAYKTAAPPFSYIDVRDFQSPQQLADYLLYLDRYPYEYAKYFWWKKYYTVVFTSDQPLCRLCEMLHENLPVKTYVDMDLWWDGAGVCRRPL